MIDTSASAIVDFEVPHQQQSNRPVRIPHRIYVEPVGEVEEHPEEVPTLLSQKVNLAVTLASVILLLVQIVQLEDPVGIDLVEVLDTVVCLTLLADFVYDFAHSPCKKRLLAQRWWEPLASIPMIDTAQQAVLAIRMLRIMRILRIFKLHREIQLHLSQGYAFLQKSRVLDLSGFVLLTILSGSLGFFYAEQGQNPNLHSYKDSLWWAMVTVTTIGYGDIYPVTTAGRVVAVGLMVIGIGCVSLFTALVASHFLKENKCPHCGGEI
jgi:voltage-gated potassium channel